MGKPIKNPAAIEIRTKIQTEVSPAVAIYIYVPKMGVANAIPTSR